MEERKQERIEIAGCAARDQKEWQTLLQTHHSPGTSKPSITAFFEEHRDSLDSLSGIAKDLGMGQGRDVHLAL